MSIITLGIQSSILGIMGKMFSYSVYCEITLFTSSSFKQNIRILIESIILKNKQTVGINLWVTT